MPIDSVLIIGAGGHAKVVIEALRSLSSTCRIEICDHDSGVSGRVICGLVVDAPFDWSEKKSRFFHVAIGNNASRGDCQRQGIEHGKLPLTIIHPSALVSASARIEQGSFVAGGSIVAADVRLGQGVIVNHGAVVDHDCMVGDYSHIAPNSTLTGGVQVGPGSLIGASSVILPRLAIGENATVGAGAVVTNDVAANSMVAGNPAKIISTC